VKSDAYMDRIRLGQYLQYEGPWTRGVYRFAIGDRPDFYRKMLGVLTATEGGRYGAVNMYDRCILTVGLIQWCEAANIFGVTKMLHKCREIDSDLLTDYLSEAPGELLFTEKGFIFNGKPVTTKEQQRAAFLGGSSGLRGQWTDEQIEHARRVCAVMSALWQEEKFRESQEAYTGKRLLGFVMPKTKKILFPELFPQEGAAGALRAAYVSFAGNLPAVADKHFRKVAETDKWKSANEMDRLVMALKEMTFGPGIAIYPHRYEAIRPVLEKQFGINLPDMAEELRTFEEPNPWAEVFPDSRSIQEALIELGHDLGPAGADNKFGAKSRAALKAFESEYECKGKPDGIPDAVSMDALAKAVAEMKTTTAEVADLVEPKPVEVEPDNEPFDEDELVPDVGEVLVVEETDENVDSEPPEAPEKAAEGSKTPYVILAFGAILAALGRLLGLY